MNAMDSSQPSQPQTPVKKILVKRVKVLVKRPVAATPSAVPAPVPAAKQPVLVKVPVKRVVTVPVQTQPVQTPAPVTMPAAPVQAQPAQPVQTPAPVRTPPAPAQNQTARQPEPGKRAYPVVFELPDDILAAVEKYKKIPQKALALYIYARTYAERVAEENGWMFPPMMLDLPHDTYEMKEIIDDVDGDEFFDAILDDLVEMAPFIDGMERIVNTKGPLEKLIKSELVRIQNKDETTTADQIVLAYLNLLVDMLMVHEKMELMDISDEIDDDIEDIKDLEEEEKEIKRKIVTAIERKRFPVNARKLVDNYFSLAKRDPDKAYETLITNPLFFSPIQMERLPKKFFGLVKPTAKDAIAVNKQMASFFRSLKV